MVKSPTKWCKLLMNAQRRIRECSIDKIMQGQHQPVLKHSHLGLDMWRMPICLNSPFNGVDSLHKFTYGACKAWIGDVGLCAAFARYHRPEDGKCYEETGRAEDVLAFANPSALRCTLRLPSLPSPPSSPLHQYLCGLRHCPHDVFITCEDKDIDLNFY